MPRSRSVSRSRSRSSSRSKVSRRGSRGPSRGKSAGAARRSARGVVNAVSKQKIDFGRMLVKVRPVVNALESAKKRNALAKASYFSTGDSKATSVTVDAQKDVDQLTRELALAVTAIRAGLKDRPVRMRLSCTFVITTTVTSGVTNTVTIGGVGNKINPVFCSEWSTCAALFEEYKCFGAEAVFNYTNQVSSTTGTVSITSNSLPIMAYDADDATAATSSQQLSVASQHKFFPVMSGSPAAPYGALMHRFHIHTPKGTVAEDTANSVMAGTEWAPVADVSAIGWLKFYHQGTVITAIDTGAGVLYFDLEFRCRS